MHDILSADVNQFSFFLENYQKNHLVIYSVSGANATMIHVCNIWETSVKFPLHNQSSQEIWLLHTTLQQNDMTALPFS